MQGSRGAVSLVVDALLRYWQGALAPFLVYMKLFPYSRFCYTNNVFDEYFVQFIGIDLISSFILNTFSVFIFSRFMKFAQLVSEK